MADTTIDNRNASLLRLATYASVGTALLLVIVKLIAWVVTGSLSILASLVDSLMDVFASLINLVAVRYSLKSPDREHKFGHGKAEALAGVGQASFIACSAVFLVIHGVDSFSNPRPLSELGTGIGIMVFAIAATMVLLLIQRYVVNHTQSVAIKADSLHYATDLIVNSATIVALLLAKAGFFNLDAVFAIGIAIYVLYSAGCIGYESAQLLMDRELPPEERERIREIARQHDLVLGVHDLRTRRSGQISVIQLHLDLDGKLPLARAHRVVKEVEGGIREAFPVSDIIIHQDPVTMSAAGVLLDD